MDEEKKNSKGILIAVVAVIILGALASYFYYGRPSSEPETLVPGGVIVKDAAVNSIDIRILESFPVQVQIVALGDLPDGCTSVKDITQQKNGPTFFVTIKTERPSDVACTQALVPFEETITLDVYGLKAGVYTVNVNGVEDTFELTTDNVPQDESKG